ncbi:MAG: hypothetical protein PHH00_03925 [Candidatus Nanoarchaeia archaeon]|nr:hypothetical protein [Candidatus Nanoarchaeia archaeon]
MAAWGKWTALVGGVLAVIGYFVWNSASWLTILGGVVAVVGALGSD